MYEELFDIKEAGAQLPLGSTETIECPFCRNDWEAQGRPSIWAPTKSMSVTRATAGILYLCHRATCTKGRGGGIVSDTLTKKHLTQQKVEWTPKICRHPMTFVSDDVYGEMVAPYHISKELMQLQEFKWLPTENRLYMPTFNAQGYTIGGTAKTRLKGLKPKVIQYRHNNVPMIHYPKGQPTVDVPLILVEDVLSALRLASAGLRAAALLGTNIGPRDLDYLTKNEREIILMLDGDASQKAVNYKRNLSTYFDTFIVVPLPYGKDPKDLTDKELKEYFNDGE